MLDKLKGYAVDLAAATTAIETTTLLKDVTQRTRPNDSGTDSFPSGHAATSAVYTRLATVNLDQIDMSDGARGALDTGLQVLNFGTAWARIEGGWHYPSDTLVRVLVHLQTLRHFSQERQFHASRCGLRNHGKPRVCEGAHDDT